ncbi:MAG: ROK family protein [Clostridia bacterium]|nr:ROK family protein [Clostridia bacterium]
MYTIGIDLGGTNIVVGLCDGDLRILHTLKVKTGKRRSPDEIVSDMARLTLEMMRSCSLSHEEVGCIGIATPGIVDLESGAVRYSCNLPFKDYPLKEIFSSLIPDIPIRVINDADAAALAESLVGAAKGTRSSVTLTLGTGVGSGIIIDGRILGGGAGFSGAELGHTVIKAGGRRCACGRYGCLEVYASATGLKNSTRECMARLRKSGTHSKLFEIAEKYGRISARVPFMAMREGDRHGAILVEHYIDYLAVGIANIINLFSPEVIIIGGGVSGEGEHLILPLTRRVAEELGSDGSEINVKITTATLGSKSGVVGAAGVGRIPV